jgi:hypothetical protein
MGDLSKTKPAMEFDRAVIRRVYRADHDVLVESERVGKHSLDQLSSNPRAAAVGPNVHRMLDGLGGCSICEVERFKQKGPDFTPHDMESHLIQSIQ